MANKLDAEARMTIKVLAERGHTNRAIARLLGVHENAVRYHRRRQTEGAVDGRSRQKHLAEAHAEAITHWLEQVDGGGLLNLAALHDWLVHEHRYTGSLRSLQRYFRARYPRPRIRARRRVETPPGAQAQADWGEYPDVRISGRVTKLSVFALKLSWSRYAAFIWSPRQDHLAYSPSQACFSLAIIEADNPFTDSPNRLFSALSKSLVDTPFKYSHGNTASSRFAFLKYRGNNAERNSGRIRHDPASSGA